MKSPQFRFLCRWHFPNFWSFPFLSFGHLWRQLWKWFFNGVPARVLLNSMITALSSKKASVCSALNSSALSHPDMVLIFFPRTLGGERDSPSFKIKLQSYVACSYLVEPGCYLLEEKGSQAFSHVHEPHLTLFNSSLSLFSFQN